MKMEKLFFSYKKAAVSCSIAILVLFLLSFLSCKKDEEKPDLAVVVTASVTEITHDSAISGGFVRIDGGADVISRGVVWSHKVNPTLENNKTVDGNGTGEYESTITGLEPSTKYYLKAYATNSVGTTYGLQVEFTTTAIIDFPVVVTLPAGSIDQASAAVGGNVTSDGGANIVDRGVYWGDQADPINTGDKLSIGTGAGSFSATLSDLSSSTTYYVTAFATNSKGTAYGGEINFTTTEDLWACGDPFTMIHAAGNLAPVDKTVTYTTVLTNLTGEEKCWITQDLGAEKQGESATDANASTTGWYWQFNRLQGYYYDGTNRIPSNPWEVPYALEDSDWLPERDPCTALLGEGWRIPTYTEYFYANDVNGLWGSRDEAYASVLKFHCTGRFTVNGAMERYGTHGYWWTATQMDNLTSGRRLTTAATVSDMGGQGKGHGFPLRCLKD